MNKSVLNYFEKIGRKGGKVKSEKKAQAARLNGMKGGYHKHKKKEENKDVK